MRVISQLADIDLEVGSLSRERNLIVVKTAPGIGIETRIEIGPRDAVQICKLMLRNPRVLAYVLALPVLAWRVRKEAPGDTNNPWTRN